MNILLFQSFCFEIKNEFLYRQFLLDWNFLFILNSYISLKNLEILMLFDKCLYVRNRLILIVYIAKSK